MTKIKFYSIRAITVTALIVQLLSLSACHAQKDLQAIKFFYSWEYIKPDDGQLVHNEDSMFVIYYKDLILYKTPYYYENSSITIHNGIVGKQGLLDSGIKYKFFIHEKESDYGFVYDSIRSQTARKFSVDSFLRTRGKGNENMFYSENDSLVSSQWLSKTVLLEKYIPKIKKDETYNDTTYLYFSKTLTKFDFSISANLDSLRKMKLYKAQFIYNPIAKGTYAFDLPKRGISFEMKEIDIKDKKAIMDILHKFELDNPK